VKEPASSPNIEGPLVTLQERQIAGGMALHASDTGGGPNGYKKSVRKVEDAKEFVGKTSEEIENESLQNLNTGHIEENNREESSHSEKAIDC